MPKPQLVSSTRSSPDAERDARRSQGMDRREPRRRATVRRRRLPDAGGTPNQPTLAAESAGHPGNIEVADQGSGLPRSAPHHVSRVQVAPVDIDRAFEIETRYFVDLVCHSQQSKNMTQAFFFDLQAINKGGSRPDGYDRWSATKVAVLAPA